MTKNHGYNTPKKGTADWNVPLNENFKKIDKDIEVRDIESKLDTYEPTAGAKFLATDTGNRYLGDGEQWNLAPLPQRGAVGDLTAQNRFRVPTREQDPENAEVGELWLRTDENALKVQMANGVQTLASGESSGDSGSDGGGTTNADVTIDFADDSYLDKFDTRRTSWNTIVDGEKARTDTALQVHLEEGSHYGTDMKYYFGDNGMSEPEELWTRYYLRLDPGFEVTSDGGKLPGPAGTYDSGGWGGKPADGTNGWSARMAFMPASGGGAKLSYYCYHADMNNWGEWWGWDGTIETDRYYQIDSYVKLNTPGENDGILRGWIDGQQAMEKTDIRFRDTDDLKVESLWFNIYHGGGDTSPSDNMLYFDNLQMSTSGPLD